MTIFHIPTYKHMTLKSIYKDINNTRQAFYYHKNTEVSRAARMYF